MRLWEFITESAKGIEGYKETDSYVNSLIGVLDKYPQAEGAIMDSMDKFIETKTRNAQEPYISPNKDKGHSGVLKPWRHAHILNASQLSAGAAPLVLYYRITQGILLLDLIQVHTSGRNAEDKRLAKKLRRAEDNDTSAVQKVEDPTQKKMSQTDYNREKEDYKRQQWYIDQQKYT